MAIQSITTIMGNYLTTFVTSWYTPNPEVLARQQQIAEHIIVGAPVVHKLKEEAINEIEPTETPSYNIVIFGDSGLVYSLKFNKSILTVKHY